MQVISLDVDDDNAIKQLRKLQSDLNEEVDNVADNIAEEGVENARDALVTQGSVATETGIKSLRAERMGKHHYATVGRTYLKYVDKGTKPHTPDIDYRLIAWASQEGWTVSGIVDHIEEEGTDPHPWIERAFNPLVKTIPDKVSLHVRRTVRFVE